MRRSRLVGLLMTAAGVVGVLVASSAAAVTPPRLVPLHLTVNGSGTVLVQGHPAFTCHAGPTRAHCRRTFQVRKGLRIVLRESPASGWKLWKWSGLACHGSAASCSLRVRARRFGFVTASFLPPGDRLNPYPLGAAASLRGGGWQMKVNSATLEATAAVDAVVVNGQPANSPPPPGAQYALVNVSMTYVGSGSSSLENYVFGWIRAEGHKNAPYPNYCIPPGTDLGSVDQVLSGQTVTGNLCFEIASHDAASLLLNGGDDEMTGVPVWFALR